MRTLLLLVISCCLLLMGGQEPSYKKTTTDHIWSSFSKSYSYFHTHEHAVKKTRVKKSGPLNHAENDSFTETDEDLSFNRHFELQVKDLFVFSIAFIWTSRPVFLKTTLPFSWSAAATQPSKYILQRVLRI